MDFRLFGAGMKTQPPYYSRVTITVLAGPEITQRAKAQEGFPRLSLPAAYVQDLTASLKRCFFSFLTTQSPELTAHDRTRWGGVPAEPLPAPALRAQTAPAFVPLSPPTPLLAHWTLVRAPAPHCWGPLGGPFPLGLSRME